MPYIAINYYSNLKQWVCTRTSSKGPFDKEPPNEVQHYPHFCGQCVSFVTDVCPTIPVNTRAWVQGKQVKGNKDISPGTAIATFKSGQYSGHAAIYESQNDYGINVVDQWVTKPATAIHQRLLRFGAKGNSNNGENFYVVD